MFRGELHGPYHRERIPDYLRQPEPSFGPPSEQKRERHNVVIGFSLLASGIAILVILVNL
ncbi:MAG: hypothetical protein HZB51_31930 [Chloroflexi bacterium]|nr:hypothetical protein [Chloroflexota bacterium]